MKIIYKLNKEFCTYGVHLDVQIRFEFLDVKHFKHYKHCDYSNQGHLTNFSTNLMNKYRGVNNNFPTNYPK